MHPLTSKIARFAQALTLASCTAAAAAHDVSDHVGAGAPVATTPTPRLIVTLAAGSDAVALRAGLDRAERLHGRRLDVVRQLATGSWLVETEDVGGERRISTDDIGPIARELARDPAVAAIEPDRLLTRAFTPNDLRYREQQSFYRNGHGTNTAGAWHYSTGAGIKVAIIDTGITPHSDLDANVLPGYDFIADAAAARDGDGRDADPNDEGDWYVAGECANDPTGSSDSSWHGTFAAGTVAALTNNNFKGSAGMAYGAKVVPVRVLGRCGGALSDVADAIVWASGGAVSGVPANANPAKVINLSLGDYASCGQTLQQAIDIAVGNGTVVVASAGNGGVNVDGYAPANCGHVVAVAATYHDHMPSYSNYGDKIDVAAPGAMIAPSNQGTTLQVAEGYASRVGTSVAAPQVAGLAAMILAKGTFAPQQVENLMKYNVTTALDCTFDPVRSCGWGRIDALHTLRAVSVGYDGNAVSTPLPSLFAKPTYFENANNYYLPSIPTVVVSPNTVWGYYGANAPAGTIVKFKLAIRGTGTVNPRDITIALSPPSGPGITLHNQGPTFATTQTVNASNSIADGLWKLIVVNEGNADNIYIDSWSITFPSGGGPL